MRLRSQTVVLRLLRLEDLLIEAARFEGEIALLVGEELTQAEIVVRLLRIVVGRVLNQILHVLDLLVGDLVDLVALLADECVDGQRGPGLLLAASLAGSLGLVSSVCVPPDTSISFFLNLA